MLTCATLIRRVVPFQNLGAPPEILLSWGSVPTAANVNGATNRLHATDALAAVKRSLSGDFSTAYPAVVQGKGTGADQPLSFIKVAS